MTTYTTSGHWFDLLVFWCSVLDIKPRPRLRIVAAQEIPGCDALTEYYQAVELGWRINVRRGRHKDPALTMCHELLHVRTGCTDAIHEPWIRALATALVKAYPYARARKITKACPNSSAARRFPLSTTKEQP